MPSAYLQWQFYSGERVVAHGPLVLLGVYVFMEKKKIMFVQMGMGVEKVSYLVLCK